MQVQSSPSLLEQTVENTGTKLLCTGGFLHTEMEVGKLQFCKISLPSLAFLADLITAKFLVSKEVLVEDQYLREA